MEKIADFFTKTLGSATIQTTPIGYDVSVPFTAKILNNDIYDVQLINDVAYSFTLVFPEYGVTWAIKNGELVYEIADNR